MKKIIYLVSLFLILFSCKSVTEKNNNVNKSYFGDFKVEPNMELSLKSDKNWYKDAIFYHIWVKAFNDSNGDGIGDIKGITQKLDYLKDLGINAIWLSPIFDCFYKGDNMHGYDTIDYYKVNPKFGTEEDLLELIKECHKRGIRIIFDYVVNHTSNMHPWFLDAKANGKKRNWYIWNKMPEKKNAKKKWGKPWESGGKWTTVWHKEGDSFYYGAFSRSMPDLNLRNPEVREAMANVLVYWLNKGFDGIRIDAARYIIEDGPQEAADRPETHLFFKRLRKDILDKYDQFETSKMMVAEAWTDANKIVPYYGDGYDEFHMCFDFPYVYSIVDIVKYGFKSSVKLNNFSNYMEFIHSIYPENAQPATFLSNHDNAASRPMSEYKNNKKNAILAFGLNIFAKGSPFVYFGNEIGMTDAEGIKGDMRFRTPFKWEMVEEQKRDKDSIFNWYKKLIDLKKSYKALRVGYYKRVDCSDPKVLAFLRYYEDEYILIVINFKEEKADVKLNFSTMNLNLVNRKLSLILGEKDDYTKIITEDNKKEIVINNISDTSFKIFKLEK
ncbi:MAG TPA: alpha-amylase family glycosyl hydrolase [Spirochaetota bacterium]|nr:alpha-amylase family glycosyl hydrolase [Spirochaetota bacterium]HOL56928.1 alpha-amylase family glycosyl hydrolase [Spirochaetota bacterium]HPP04642.1 alpha-amylase family glycosyl hydrolase [Spirochaetota bacterium]